MIQNSLLSLYDHKGNSRLCVASYATDSNWAVIFIDQIEAIKLLSGCEATHCNEHQFHAKL